MATIVIDERAEARAGRVAGLVRARFAGSSTPRIIVANPALGARERARVAFHNAADVFVCCGYGADAEVATDPRHHHPRTRIVRARDDASALRAIELALEDPPRAIDVWNEVPLVAQRTGMSCWAAAAAMIVGWRDLAVVDPEQIARAASRWDAYQEGLEPEDVPALARQWGLTMEPPGRRTLDDFRELLSRRGPLWVGEASPGLHSVVLTGIRGDGTPEGTMLHIADPWPLGRGERYSVTFRDFMRNFEAAAGKDGLDTPILHAGGRARGTSPPTNGRTLSAARASHSREG